MLHYPAKPWLMNESLHRMARHERFQQWKGDFKLLAAAAGAPRGLPHVALSVRQFFTSKRPPDCDAPAPGVKAAIDGLVRYGVVPDDSPTYVGPITYELPIRAREPGLELIVTPTQ